MPVLTIPEVYHRGLAELVSLDREATDEILHILDSLTPAIYHQALPVEVESKLVTLPPETASEIVEALHGLAIGRATIGMPIAIFAEEVVQAIESGDVADAALLPEARESFKETLSELLRTDALVVGAKAWSLLFEHEHNLMSARVFTDIRPVFGDSVKDAPAGAFTVHTLKISYRPSQSGELREFFVAMDTRDIDLLIETLERARSKGDSVQRLLQSSGVTYIQAE